MLYILIGEDDYSRHQELEKIKLGIGDPALLSTNTNILDGQKLREGELKAITETMPFLSAKRLVIVRGLLMRFEARSRSGRKKDKDRQDNLQGLGACISQLPDSTVLVLVDDVISKQNPLLTKLVPLATVKYFPLLTGSKLRQWVKQRVIAGGNTISNEAISMIVELVGRDLWAMDGEINKLLQFTAGEPIDKSHVEVVVSHVQQLSIFDMVDAILDLDPGKAHSATQQLLQRGSSPAYLLVMLTRQFRMIVLMHEMKLQNRTDKEIRERLGIASEFVFRKTLDEAKLFSLPRLKEIYRKLLETDLAIKTGQYDSELAINILVAELCQLVPRH